MVSDVRRPVEGRDVENYVLVNEGEDGRCQPPYHKPVNRCGKSDRGQTTSKRLCCKGYSWQNTRAAQATKRGFQVKIPPEHEHGGADAD